MDIRAKKLELMQLLLNTQRESETQHLLSTPANRKHLAESIDQLNKGKGKAIKTSDLWK